MKPQHLAQIRSMLSETDKTLTMKRREQSAAKAQLEEVTIRAERLDDEVRKLANTAQYLANALEEWQSKDVEPARVHVLPSSLTDGSDLVG